MDLIHCQRLIVSVDMMQGGVAPKTHQEDRAKAQHLMHKHGLCPVFFLDLDNGGATDACHVFGFGNNLGLSILPASDQGLTQTLRHFMDGGMEGRFLDSHRVLKTSIPELVDPPRRVLWHEDVVLAVGLFSCLLPGACIYCPLHFPPQSGLNIPC